MPAPYRQLGGLVARVLLVGKGPPERGGIPSFIQTLLESDLRRSHDVTFLNLAHGGPAQGGRVSLANVRRTLTDMAALWRAASGQDVVHLHSALAPAVTLVRAGLLGLTARARRCRVVVHGHGGLGVLWLSGRRRRLLARAALAPAHRVLVVSSQLRERLAGALGVHAVTLVDNGVDTSRFAGDNAAHDPPRLLYVGLLTARKGVLDLLAASARLTDRGVAHAVWLVGGAPDEGQEAARPVIAAAQDLGARLLGQQPPEQMPGLYREGDVFCLPSWWEAMPLSILEAMASGLPVVASDVGDISRVVQDGVTGSLVLPRDPSRLADALEPLLQDPERRRELGRAGRDLVAGSFSSATTVATLDRIYCELGARDA